MCLGKGKGKKLQQSEHKVQTRKNLDCSAGSWKPPPENYLVGKVIPHFPYKVLDTMLLFDLCL
jgi:hypothetical protein